jgi:AcrR family transcriptional regulator
MTTSPGNRQTRLSRELQRAEPSRRATPRDAFELAMGKWVKGERVEIGAVAEELGVNRATVFRWVGSRELLLGEIVWQRFAAIWKFATQTAKGVGADYAADFTRRVMEAALESEPLRRFIAHDPEYALRLLTSKTSTVQARIVEAVCVLLREQAEAGHIAPALSIEDLAYALVRIVESCLYSDQITGRKPNTVVTSEVIRILVAARPGTQPEPGGPRRQRSRKQTGKP